jgi:hypothetical protein
MRRYTGVVSLPDTVRVRITSETAESIGLSPVVVQEMTLEELVRQMLGVTGKDAERIHEILSRGSLVAGASRFRWDGIDAVETEVASFLARFPDPDPSRPFEPERCFLAILLSHGRQLTIERAAGEKRRLFRRQNFWEELLRLVSRPAYMHYSYRESADVYRRTVDAALLAELRTASKLLAYSTFETHIRTATVTAIDLFTRRSG